MPGHELNGYTNGYLGYPHQNGHCPAANGTSQKPLIAAPTSAPSNQGSLPASPKLPAFIFGIAFGLVLVCILKPRTV